jgi:hypothetical protein
MRSTPSSIVVSVLLLVFGCVASTVQASVFRLDGKAWSGWMPTGGLPWEKAYETDMVVDGKTVSLHLYSARYSEPVLEQLKSALAAVGAEMAFSTTQTGISGIAHKGDYELRVLVASPAGEPRHLVFLTYANPAEARPMKEPVPRYPNSRKLTATQNLSTGTDYLSLTTTDTAYQLHDFYEQKLLADGWNRVTPPAHIREGATGMVVYQRKDKVCYIQVRQNKGLSSTLTILVKKGTM